MIMNEIGWHAFKTRDNPNGDSARQLLDAERVLSLETLTSNEDNDVHQGKPAPLSHDCKSDNSIPHEINSKPDKLAMIDDKLTMMPECNAIDGKTCTT